MSRVNESILRAEIEGLRVRVKVLEAALYERAPPPEEYDPGLRERPHWGIGLSNQQFAIMHMLVEAQGQMVSRDYLMEHLPGKSSDRDPKILTTLVSKLRAHFNDPGIIVSVLGEGYRIDLKRLPARDGD